MATPQQEREWIAQLEEMGVARVKLIWDRNEISQGYVSVTSAWLAQKEQEAKRQEEARQSEQMELMRRDSAAIERQAAAAEQANTKARIAIWVAAISAASAALSLIVSIIAFFKH